MKKFLKSNLLWVLLALLFVLLPILLIPTQTPPETFRKDVEKSGFELPEEELPITRIWLVGDATLYQVPETTAESTGSVSWGDLLNQSFLSRAYFLNVANETASSYSYTLSDEYRSLIDKLRENDIVLIQFGCNDSVLDEEDATPPRHTDPLAPVESADESGFLPDGSISYKAILYRFFIEPIRAKGAVPVLLSSVVQLNYFNVPDPSYRLAPYRDAMKDLSEVYGVPFFDVLTETSRQFSQIYMLDGPEGVRPLYARAAYDETLLQMNYLTPEGASYVSDFVKERLLEEFPQLSDYLIEPEDSNDAENHSGVIFDPSAPQTANGGN